MRSALRPSDLPLPVKRELDMDDELCIDSEGRLIINEDGKVDTKHKQELSFDGCSEGASLSFASSHKTKRRRKTPEIGLARTGKIYASRKGGGDVRQNGKLQPYAYWSLDRRMTSRRPGHRASARKGMASVVKLTKRLQGKSVSNSRCMGDTVLKKMGRRNIT